MKIEVEWNKIVTQAISTLIIAVFIGAASIVWMGATSVDTKVQNTRDDMQHLITTLSDKMAGYESQLTTISNQLEIISNNQSNLIVISRKSLVDGVKNSKAIAYGTNEPMTDYFRAIQQKANSQDIMHQLKR